MRLLLCNEGTGDDGPNATFKSLWDPWLRYKRQDVVIRQLWSFGILLGGAVPFRMLGVKLLLGKESETMVQRNWRRCVAIRRLHAAIGPCKCVQPSCRQQLHRLISAIVLQATMPALSHLVDFGKDCECNWSFNLPGVIIYWCSVPFFCKPSSAIASFGEINRRPFVQAVQLKAFAGFAFCGNARPLSLFIEVWIQRIDKRTHAVSFKKSSTCSCYKYVLLLYLRQVTLPKGTGVPLFCVKFKQPC